MTERFSLDRRQFLGFGAVAAAGAAIGLAGCSPQAPAAGGVDAPAAAASGSATAATGGTPSFLVPPDPIAEADISQTVECDVAVVGAGVAGLCAARAAAEQGARVIVVEKGETFQYRSGGYGVHGSALQKEHGMDFDAQGAVSALMKEMGYRPNQRLWNEWRDHSGEAFDWLLEPTGGDYDFIVRTDTAYDPTRVTIQATHFPVPEGYDPAKEYSPSYPEATLIFIPDQKNILELTYQKALDLGAEFRFSTWARQLVRPNSTGRVEGVIIQDIDGEYTKVLASKGVIMCAGDYGNNPEMVSHYCGGRTYVPFFSNVDAKGDLTNKGEGQCMAAWVGAKIEDGPHAPMTHTLGAALGTDGFLLLNTRGQRFVNEDVAGQQLSSQIYRQPEDKAWQIFDDKYPDQVEKMGVAHGAVNHVVPESENPHLEGAAMTIGRTAITSREEVEGSEGIVIADTLEELASKMGLDAAGQKNLLASIARYNELADKGVDEDFGKAGSRLFPVATPPFYASPMAAGVMLVCLGGLTVDPDTLAVLNEDYVEIEGLYAAGNNMGCRILQDYPVTIGGVSHATALVYGKLAGESAARA